MNLAGAVLVFWMVSGVLFFLLRSGIISDGGFNYAFTTTFLVFCVSSVYLAGVLVGEFWYA